MNSSRFASLSRISSSPYSVRLGTDVPIKHKKQAGVLFDTIAQKYFDDLQLHSNENTIRDRKNKYDKHLYEVFGKQSVDRIKSDELEDLQREKIKTLSPKTVNQLTELFSTIFNYGTRKEGKRLKSCLKL